MVDVLLYIDHTHRLWLGKAFPNQLHHIVVVVAISNHHYTV